MPIRGRDAKLYGANNASNGYSTLLAGWDSAVFLSTISIGFPVKDGDGTTLGGQNYLFQNGSFVNATAELWSQYAADWQMMPILMVNNGYRGAVPLSEAYALFPYRITGDRWGYNTYYVTDDDMDEVQIIYVGPQSSPATYGFLKSTLTRVDSVKLLNFAVWGSNSYPAYNWSSLYFITGIANPLCLYKGSITYATSSQNNSWWLNSTSNAWPAGMTTWQDNYTPRREITDPYQDGGFSGPGGGTGGYGDTSDPIDFPALPSLSAASTGFITLFNPSLTQLQSLASYMWSNLFDVASFQKLFADPMDAILGLSIVPVAVPEGASREIKVGNIGTSIQMTTAASQYVEVDCGSINVEEFWGAYLDWAPYTKAELYLPYCGIHPISIDDIMGRTVAIKYHVDILSGSCVAYVKCGTSVLYSFAGQCSSSIPVNATNWASMINGALSIAAAVGSMVASGGATAPMVAGSVGIASTAVNSLKPTVERSGSMSGTAGLLNLQTPYLILTRPRQALPERQNTFTGYPAFITAVLGDLEGWTVVSEIHLEGVPCTEAEASEIQQLLKTGVIL